MPLIAPSAVDEGSDIVGRKTVSLGEWLTTFRRIVVPSSSKIGRTENNGAPNPGR